VTSLFSILVQNDALSLSLAQKAPLERRRAGKSWGSPHAGGAGRVKLVEPNIRLYIFRGIFLAEPACGSTKNASTSVAPPPSKIRRLNVWRGTVFLVVHSTEIDQSGGATPKNDGTF